MEQVNKYTLEELSFGENDRKIVLQTSEGIELIIEEMSNGTAIYLSFGGKIEEREFDYLLTPNKG